MFDPDAPVDYINERNKKFNDKLEKFYGKYTEDIKVSTWFHTFSYLYFIFYAFISIPGRFGTRNSRIM